MAAIVWDNKAVADFLQNSPLANAFARVKSPRGLKEILRKQYGRTLYRNCFRNALAVGLWSEGCYLYCEGFASRTVGGQTRWFAHAWNAMVQDTAGNAFDLVQTPWCIDTTWPADYGGELLESDTYVGICIEAHVAVDFAAYLRKQGIEHPATSVLKEVHYFKQFLTGMH